MGSTAVRRAGRNVDDARVTVRPRTRDDLGPLTYYPLGVW